MFRDVSIEPGKEEEFRHLQGWLASSDWLDRLIEATEAAGESVDVHVPAPLPHGATRPTALPSEALRPRPVPAAAVAASLASPKMAPRTHMMNARKPWSILLAALPLTLGWWRAIATTKRRSCGAQGTSLPNNPSSRTSTP
jgi:hypothetical protein